MKHRDRVAPDTVPPMGPLVPSLQPVPEVLAPVDDPAVDDGHRRGRVLRALAVCMAEKGYRATTMSDIARVGQVSKCVVHAHFRDGEDAGEAVWRIGVPSASRWALRAVRTTTSSSTDSGVESAIAVAPQSRPVP